MRHRGDGTVDDLEVTRVHQVIAAQDHDVLCRCAADRFAIVLGDAKVCGVARIADARIVDAGEMLSDGGIRVTIVDDDEAPIGI